MGNPPPPILYLNKYSSYKGGGRVAGVSVSQSHANNGKYLVYQKKIISHQIGKPAISGLTRLIPT